MKKLLEQQSSGWKLKESVQGLNFERIQIEQRNEIRSNLFNPARVFNNVMSLNTRFSRDKLLYPPITSSKESTPTHTIKKHFRNQSQDNCLEITPMLRLHSYSRDQNINSAVTSPEKTESIQFIQKLPNVRILHSYVTSPRKNQENNSIPNQELMETIRGGDCKILKSLQTRLSQDINVVTEEVLLAGYSKVKNKNTHKGILKSFRIKQPTLKQISSDFIIIDPQFGSVAKILKEKMLETTPKQQFKRDQQQSSQSRWQIKSRNSNTDIQYITSQNLSTKNQFYGEQRIGVNLKSSYPQIQKPSFETLPICFQGTSHRIYQNLLQEETKDLQLSNKKAPNKLAPITLKLNYGRESGMKSAFQTQEESEIIQQVPSQLSQTLECLGKQANPQEQEIKFSSKLTERVADSKQKPRKVVIKATRMKNNMQRKLSFDEVERFEADQYFDKTTTLCDWFKNKSQDDFD